MHQIFMAMKLCVFTIATALLTAYQFAAVEVPSVTDIGIFGSLGGAATFLWRRMDKTQEKATEILTMAQDKAFEIQKTAYEKQGIELIHAREEANQLRDQLIDMAMTIAKVKIETDDEKVLDIVEGQGKISPVVLTPREALNETDD